MTLTQGIFPYDVADLAVGPVRLLIAPSGTTLPADAEGLEKVFDQVSPYAPTTGWVDLGATEGATTYNRNLTTNEFRIEQSTAIIVEEITGLERTIVMPLASYSMRTLAIFEAANTATQPVVAAVGHSAQTKLQVGTVTSLPTYRIAMIAMRDTTAGEVQEGASGPKRGRFFGFVGYQAKLSAENSAISLARSSLATLPITVRLFPEPGKPQGTEHGFHIDEAAGTLATA